MKNIVIDAGHGYYTAGKRCIKILDPNQTREWTLNDRIADKVEELLKAYECNVLRTDDTTGVKDVSLNSRVKSANSYGADMFISIHHNAGVNGGTGGGTVIYYCSSKTERKTQAQALYNHIVTQTDLKGNRASKVIKKSFTVIKNTTMPAFLIENGFMDSVTDVPIILTEAHANKTAQGIVNFLVKELKLVKKVVAATVKSYTVGQVISLKAGAKYYNGKSIPKWVLKKTLYYRGKNDNGIIFSTLRTGAITGVVKPEYVI